MSLEGVRPKSVVRRALVLGCAVTGVLASAVIGATPAQAISGYGGVVLYPASGSGTVIWARSLNTWYSYNLKDIGFNNVATRMEQGGSKTQYGCWSEFYENDNSGGGYRYIADGTAHVRDLYQYSKLDLTKAKYDNGHSMNKTVSSIRIYCANRT